MIEFGPPLAALAAQMLELMKDARGVGLAAPQVGQNIRMFVMNHSGEPSDNRVYINPEISEIEGADEAEEGCLSLPGIHARIIRGQTARMNAVDLAGNPIVETATEYVARIWQHEYDHLDGVLLLDRLGPVAKLAVRKTLRELRKNWDSR